MPIWIKYKTNQLTLDLRLKEKKNVFHISDVVKHIPVLGQEKSYCLQGSL